MAVTARVAHAAIERSSIGPVTHVRITGAIDETFAPSKVAEGATGAVLIDLGRVDRISSFGVRQWMEFTRTLPKGVTAIYVVNAPPTFVDQLAMVEGFAGVAVVLSVLAPYVCDRCSADRMRLIDVRASAAELARGEAPKHTCPACKGPLSFGDNPEEYFAYMKSHPVGQVDPTVDRYLRSLKTPELDQTGSHLKVVDGDLTFIRLAGPLRGDLNPRRLAGGLQGVVAYDFGQVSSIEPDAVPKLVAMLKTAAAEARVHLWRVTTPLLEVLANAGRELPPNVAIGTLQLYPECPACGERAPQSVRASSYVRELKTGRPEPRRCQVCGGALSVPAVPTALALLEQRAGTDTPFEAIEALEPRALSQYLSLSAGKKDKDTGIRPVEGEQLQILRRIGQGGMAEVFLARQLGLKGFEKYVVLKKILPQFASQPEFVEMLFAEARSAARLTHPNIVQTFTVGMMEGSAYITMEYVRGADLRRLMVMLKRSGQMLPIEHALRIVAETAAGLHYAHCYVDPTGVSHPVVHRDVSPHNVLVSIDGAIKLSDFGIAKALGDSEHTQPGMLKGKIGYVSPEAVRGQPIDGRADVFALGVTTFELLTMRLPFRREAEIATLRAIAQDPPPDIRQLNPAVPADVAAVVYRALEKDRSKRYNAGQFREAIEEVMARNGIRSSPANVAEYFRSALPELSVELAPVSPPTPPPQRTGSASIPAVDAMEVSLLLTHEVGNDNVTVARTPSGVAIPQPPPARPPEPQRHPTQATVPAVPGPAPLPQHPYAAQPSHPAMPQPPMGYPPQTGSPPYPPPQRTVSQPSLPQGSLPQMPLPQLPVPQAPLPQLQSMQPSPLQQQFPSLQRQAAPLPQPQPAAKASSKLSPKWIAVGAVGLLILVGGGWLALRQPESIIKIINVQPDERLYVNGLRWEGATVKTRKNEKIAVALAREGLMSRFGVMSGPTVDVELLQELRVPPGERAPLVVNSDPRGCQVAIGGAHVQSSTPTATSMEAGREVLVEVLCPGLPRWTKWVMAAPGQSVQVSARMFDEAK